MVSPNLNICFGRKNLLILAGTVPVDTWTDEDDAHLQDEKVWPVGK